MQKNTAGKWVVFAFEDEGGTNPGEPVTGDAANITANVRIDGGAANAVDDTNPTELEDGYYVFDLTATETNGDLLLLAPASATANVNVIGCPAAIYTTPANFPSLSISSGQVALLTATQASIDAIETDTNSLNDTKIPQTLNLTASGNIGVDWANVENATNATNLSGTTTNLCNTVTTLTNKTGFSISGTITTLDGLENISAAEVNTQADLALSDIGLDHLIGSALPTSWAVDVAANSVFDQIADDGTASYDRTSDSLQAFRDHVGDGTNLTEAGGDGDHLTESGGTGDQLTALATAASITALNDLAAADVLTQVNAALDTAISELGVAAPTATPTLRTGLMLLYMALRNKTVVQTSGTDALEIYNDAGTKIASKLLTDAAGDYTEAEMT